MEKIDRTKAVDFLGIYGKQDLYLIEVKDFRGHRIENRARMLTGGLAVELAQKVKDSISCIVGAYRTENNPELWNPFAKILLNISGKVKAVLWLETDLLPGSVFPKQKVRYSVSTKILKQKMNWLTSHVLICSRSMNSLPDVEVRNLPMQETL
ncbi:MAG: hypothetical protein R2941_01550 [Desulfobacterales bacterium]